MNAEKEKVHFVGVAGFGVSALAQFHVMGGGGATGSDRIFDHGGAPELRKQLERLGITLHPQDGSAIDASHAYVVASAAVEDDIKDVMRARQLGLRVIHRAECLAGHVKSHRTIAVAGTSGKSTVVAMIFEILEAAGLFPSVITGGPLLSLERQGLVGNAFKGKSDLLTVEADESDGTLVRYRPWLGVFLNVSKDHKEVAELESLFAQFRKNSTHWLDARGLVAGKIELGPNDSRFVFDGIQFELPVPGRHNIDNALAAVSACRQVGVGLADAVKALSAFKGVARRFQRVGSAGGVEVVDDFAHNPVKVRATLSAARLRGRRILAVFQLHGFTPARFMKTEFLDVFSGALEPIDILWLPEIYYIGGTVAKDISAGDYARDLVARGKDARFFPDRSAIISDILNVVEPGDMILLMGARDPSLPQFAKQILAALQNRGKIER